MFDQVVKSLLIWMIVTTLLVITVSYIVSNTVTLGVDAHKAAYSLDRYEPSLSIQ